MRTVGKLEKRSKRPTRSGTKPFVGLNLKTKPNNFVIFNEKSSNLAILTKFGKGEALGLVPKPFEQPKKFVVELGSTEHYYQDGF